MEELLLTVYVSRFLEIAGVDIIEMGPSGTLKICFQVPDPITFLLLPATFESSFSLTRQSCRYASRGMRDASSLLFFSTAN